MDRNGELARPGAERAGDELDRVLARHGTAQRLTEADRLAVRIAETVIVAARASGIPIAQIVKMPLARVEALAQEECDGRLRQDG